VAAGGVAEEKAAEAMVEMKVEAAQVAGVTEVAYSAEV